MHSDISLPLSGGTDIWYPRHLIVLLAINFRRRLSKISNWAHVCKNNPKTKVSVPTFMIEAKHTDMIC